MEALEERTRALEARVAQLEGRRPARKAPPRPQAITRAAAAPLPRPALRAAATGGAASQAAAARGTASQAAAARGVASEAAAAREAAPHTRARMGRPDGAALEDLLGGRVLAWVGGLAVLVGIVFLLAIAVSRGWIGEEARTVMAGLGS